MRLTNLLLGFHQGETLARILMNTALERVTLSGTVLDVGAGHSAPSYFQHLRMDRGGTRISLDIDPHVRPDVVADAERPLPFQTDSVDAVLCMNLLEHTWDFRTVALEAHRVLRPGGQFIGSTPFLYPIHPFPRKYFDDFFRFTDTAITKLLAGTGYAHSRVQPLGVGPACAGLFVLELPFIPLLRLIPFLRAVLFGAAWLFDWLVYFPFLRLRHRVTDTPYVLMYVFQGLKMDAAGVSRTNG